mgnify:CR=1 FL=1
MENVHCKISILVTLSPLIKVYTISNQSLKSSSIPLYERRKEYLLPLAKGGWEGFCKDVFKPLNWYAFRNDNFAMLNLHFALVCYSSMPLREESPF